LPHRLKNIALLLVASLLILASCRSTKHVPEGEHLLSTCKIDIKGDALNEDDISSYVKQKPNKRVLRMKFYLGLYNLSSYKHNRFYNTWLQKIGEAPVLYDPLLTQRSVSQLQQYMQNKGYYNAQVTDSVHFTKRKAFLWYRISTGAPLRINNIRYQFEDTSLQSVIRKDSVNSLIRSGKIFDVDLLQKERDRIELFMRNNGYFYFTKDYVYYEADTVSAPGKANLSISFKKFVHKLPDNSLETVNHRKYKINQVNIYPNYESGKIFNANDSNQFNDTIVSNNTFIIFNRKPFVKRSVLLQSTFISPGDVFKLNNVEQTYNRFSSLKVYLLSNIRFSEGNNTADSSGYYPLNCNIDLVPASKQSHTAELEGTNSSGFLGAAANMKYQHKNLFGGAETFDLSFKAAFEWVKATYSTQYDNTIELGAETSIRFPKMLFFNQGINFVKKHNPQTDITLAYNFQRLPYYTETSVNISMGYRWRSGRYVQHLLTPVNINFVNLPFISDYFADSIIAGTYLETSYQNHLVPVTSYTFIFNNQNLNKNNDFIFYRMNLQSAGFIIHSINKIFNENHTDTTVYHIFQTPYSQFLRADFDLRYNQIIDQNQRAVYRVYFGIGVPYGNSEALPFEQKFFSGGANSIRAWSPRTIGPGRYTETTALKYPNSTGDIKFEVNAEYRFRMFWKLEGALFAETGNVWEINKEEDRPGANFEWNRALADLAVGSGLGFRFNFGFFLARFDLGLKLRYPGEQWIPGRRSFTHNDLGYNIAIDYPF